MTRAYLDYNATAPLRPEARTAMVEALACVGNPSSVHAEGRAARALVEGARRSVADLVGAEAADVTFTGGGSEANTTVLTPDWSREGAPLTVAALVVSAVEHPSVLAGGRFGGARTGIAPVDENGVIDVEALEARLRALPSPVLVSVMMANNETGVRQPVADVAGIVHDHDGILHVDAIQAAGKIDVDLAAIGADVITLSAHKLGGPRGVGAIVRAPAAPDFAPLVTGGGQEFRRRAGTENVAAIAGFGAAAAVARPDAALVARWQSMMAGLRDTVGPEAVVFGEDVPKLPQTLCFGLPGRTAETLVIGLDLEGIAVSSGAACSSGKVEPSHVLAAMRVPADAARSAIRISLGWESDQNDIDLFACAWRNVLSLAHH